VGRIERQFERANAVLSEQNRTINQLRASNNHLLAMLSEQNRTINKLQVRVLALEKDFGGLMELARSAVTQDVVANLVAAGEMRRTQSQQHDQHPAEEVPIPATLSRRIIDNHRLFNSSLPLPERLSSDAFAS
jgi:chromosome segregation ATPase